MGSRRRPARPAGRPAAARGRGAGRGPADASPSCSTSCATPSCASRRSGCGSRNGANTARGEDVTLMDAVLRHPGDAKVTTTHPGAARSWPTTRSGSPTATSSGRTRASTGSGTQRPVRNRPRGLDDPDFPGPSRVYEPVTALPMETLPDTFVHPAGYCQNVLATGRCMVTGTRRRRRPRGDPARVRPPAHDRAGRRPARLPHLARGRPRDRRHPAPGRDDRRRRHPARRGRRPRARCAAAAVRLRLRLPHRDDDALLSLGPFRRAPASRVSSGHRFPSRRCRLRERRVQATESAVAPALRRHAADRGRPSDPRVIPAHPRRSRAAPRTGMPPPHPVRISKGEPVVRPPTARSRLE